MKCPTCPTTALVMTDRSGIEIDYCPDCRGIWLDRGELDKIIERANAAAASPNNSYPLDLQTFAERPTRRNDDHDDDHDDDDDRRKSQFGQVHDGRSATKRRKKSLFGELFDF